MLVPKVIPRVLPKTMLDVVCKAPPFRVIDAAVAALGATPKLLLLLIERMPPFTIVATAKLVVP